MTESASPLICARGLRRAYGAPEAQVAALRGVDFDIQNGEFVAITGPSGSGKSTLLNLMGLLDTATGGTLTLSGHQIQMLSVDARARLRGQLIGFVFQNFGLLARTTALENVALPLIYRGVGRAARRALAEEALARVGLSDRAGHTPSQLSGGQQQRVAIARALVTKPPLLLADEPTGNLDSTTSRDVMRLLRGLVREGMTLVLVTHDPEIAAHADRTLTCRDGLFARDKPEGQL